MVIPLWCSKCRRIIGVPKKEWLNQPGLTRCCDKDMERLMLVFDDLSKLPPAIVYAIPQTQ